MNERLKQQLDFILEIDKEKNILRQTHLSGHGRRENGVKLQLLKDKREKSSEGRCRK